MEITSGKWDGKDSAYAGYAYDVFEEDGDNYFVFYSNNKNKNGQPSLSGKVLISVKNYNTGAKVPDKKISDGFVNALVDKMFSYVKGETDFEEIFQDLGALPDGFFTEESVNSGARRLRIKMREGNVPYSQATYDKADGAIKRYVTYVAETHNFTFPDEKPLIPQDMQFFSTSSHLHKSDPYIGF